MKKASLKISAFYFLLIIFINSQNVSSQYAVGDTVANFALIDVNGDSILLSNYQGKVIVLNFFTSHG